jgi:hypothetical protein
MLLENTKRSIKLNEVNIKTIDVKSSKKRKIETEIRKILITNTKNRRYCIRRRKTKNS